MKRIESIKTKPEWEIQDDWSSHLPALYFALTSETYSHVTEFGGGLNSTIRLYHYCANMQIPFTCFESNPEWIAKLKEKCPLAVITQVDSYLDILPCFNKDILLFIDCAPGEIRKELLLRNAHAAKVIVVHDTEPGAEYVYHMHNALDSFTYRLNFTPEGNPHTAIVSNFINVNQWKFT